MDSEQFYVAIVYCLLGLAVAVYAVIQTIREFRAPQKEPKSFGYPLFSRIGEGFLPKLEVAETDKTSTKLGKRMMCCGWYMLAIGLGGIGVIPAVEVSGWTVDGHVLVVGQLLFVGAVFFLLFGKVLKHVSR